MAVRLEMRVDMRRWALVFLCSIGGMGGGCSARSLLSVGFTVRGEAITGTPSIEVDWSGGSREVQGTDFTVTSVATKLGVYLDYEGPVHVTATLRPSTGVGCDWKGERSDFPVHRGERADLTIVLEERCAHPDGGAPIAEAGTDGPPDVDVGPTLVPDGGGAEAPAGVAACMEYCNTYLERCRDWGAGGMTPSECLLTCRPWPIGDPDAGLGQNTLACRWTFLRSAVGSGPPCSMCPAAGPYSPACNGSIVDAGTRDACPFDVDSGGGS